MAPRGRPRSFDRAEALRRAMDVFWAKGYEGASVAELTRAMGINSPSLYAAFGSKDALFREAVTLYQETEGAAVAKALRDEPTARDAIEAVLRHHARTYCRPDKPRGCMVVLAAPLRTEDNAAVHAFLAARRAEACGQIAARLERGIADGDVPAGVDIAAVAGFYATLMQGLSVQARDGASAKSLDAVIDCAMATWDTLVRPPAAKSEPL